MHILHSIILGLIQGLTEFLPVSSSGHLVILPWLFGWEKHPLIFDVILHSGTLLAIIIYFRREWIKILRERGKLFWCIIIASLPGVIVGATSGREIENYFRNPLCVALMLGIFGLALYISDLYGKKNKSLKDITLRAALLIGIFQMLAIIPGVSRSGITITAALLLGMDRESSVRFSFLLGGPIILAAACYTLGELVGTSRSLPWPAFLNGLVVSFLSSMIAIHFLLSFIKRHRFTPFVVYRLALPLIIVLLFLI